MSITKIEEIPAMMREWPTNDSKAPTLDDECARLDSERLAKWWLTLGPEGFTTSIDAGMTDKGDGWHIRFELYHAVATKPFRCFRVLVQHRKPPRVYQLQFPMEVKELPGTVAMRTSFQDLIERSERRAADSNLRDNVENKSVKSISLYRRFSEKQFDRFTALVTQFIGEIRTILSSRSVEGA